LLERFKIGSANNFKAHKKFDNKTITLNLENFPNCNKKSFDKRITLQLN
jgi:hypothetical protein